MPDNDRFKEIERMYEEIKSKASISEPAMGHACPHCGYCPHCGRGGYRPYPYWWGQWPYTITYTVPTTMGNY